MLALALIWKSRFSFRFGGHCFSCFDQSISVSISHSSGESLNTTRYQRIRCQNKFYVFFSSAEILFLTLGSLKQISTSRHTIRTTLLLTISFSVLTTCGLDVCVFSRRTRSLKEVETLKHIVLVLRQIAIRFPQSQHKNNDNIELLVQKFNYFFVWIFS